jgi:hypothetical protein
MIISMTVRVMSAAFLIMAMMSISQQIITQRDVMQALTRVGTQHAKKHSKIQMQDMTPLPSNVTACCLLYKGCKIVLEHGVRDIGSYRVLNASIGQPGIMGQLAAASGCLVKPI